MLPAAVDAHDAPTSPGWSPPSLPPLLGGLPGWIADDAFVWRVASDRAGDILSRAMWLVHIPAVLEVVDEILAGDHPSDTVHPDLARVGLEFLRDVVAALPTPLRRRTLPDLAMLRVLPPFLVLSPVNPFLVALRLDAERLARLFITPTDAGSLSLVANRLYDLLATYRAAAAVIVVAQEQDDHTPPPGGAA